MAYKMNLSPILVLSFIIIACSAKGPARPIGGSTSESSNSGNNTCSDDYCSPYENLANYIYSMSHPEIRPYNNGDAIDVHVGYALRTILQLDSTEQVLAMDLWMRKRWFDPNLAWDPADYSNLTVLRVSGQNMWVPEVVVYNTLETRKGLQELKEEFRITVYNDGTCLWMHPRLLHITCQLNLAMWPYDSQECHIEIGTWTYTGLELRIFNMSENMDTNYVKLNGEWELSATRVEPSVVYYNSSSVGAIPYYGLKFYITLRRRAGYFLQNIGLMTSLMLGLVLVGVLVPPDEDQRVNFGMTIFLSQMVMLLVVAEHLPVQSLAMPLMCQFMTLALINMTLFLVMSMLCQGLYEHAKAHVRAPRYLRILLLNDACLMICFPFTWRKYQEQISGNIQDGECKPSENEDSRRDGHIHKVDTDQMRSEFERLLTLRKNDVVGAVDLARAGFYFVGPGDKLKCAFCYGEVERWLLGEKGLNKHKELFGYVCPFINGLDVGNIPLSKTPQINAVILLDATTKSTNDFDSTSQSDSASDPKEEFREVELDGQHQWKIIAVMFQKLCDFVLVVFTLLHFLWIVSVYTCGTWGHEEHCPLWVMNPLGAESTIL